MKISSIKTAWDGLYSYQVWINDEFIGSFNGRNKDEAIKLAILKKSKGEN